MAFKKKFSFKKKRGTKRRTYKSKSLTKSAKKAVRKIAKSEVHKADEDKFIIDTYTGYNLSNGSASAIDGSINPVSPGVNSDLTITSGNTRSSRVGNKITTKRLTFSAQISAYPYSAVNNPGPSPFLLDVYLFYDKENPQGINTSTIGTGLYQAPTPAANADFFYNDGSTSNTQGFSYTLQDHFKVVNDARYKVFWKKTYKIGYANYAGSGANAVAQNWANNDFKLSQMVNYGLTKHYNKVVKFRNSTDSLPQNHGLWLLFVPMKPDGGAWPQATTICGTMTFKNSYYYEDA